MNEVWRTLLISSSNVNVASLVKIWRSGQNRIRVPVTPLRTRPPLCSPDRGVNAASGPSPAKTPGAPAPPVQPRPGRERRLGAVAVEDARRAAVEAHRLGGRVAVHLDVEPRR